jgi:polyphosphate kinase 2 (PPK2 family)
MEAPETRWQFSPADIKARARWDDYMEAYSEALTETNTEAAPWHVVPADREWVARAAVASVVAETLEGFHEGYPEPTEEEAEELEKGRAALLSEGD